MSLDITKIQKFTDMKDLTDEELVDYAMLAGNVDLTQSKLTRKDLMSRCATIFLNYKKANGIPDPQVTESPKTSTAAPVMEAPKGPAPVSTPPTQEPPKPSTAAPATKKARGKSEEKSQRELDLQESFDAAKEKGQDFPRCGYGCGTAITVDTGVRDGNNKPVCEGCADKIKTSKKKKEEVMATAKAKKKEAKKGTGRKGNAAALAKARDSVKKDAAGFREGSGTSQFFLALRKGATMEELKKIKPNASAFLSAFRKQYGMKIEENERSGKFHVVSFKEVK